MSKQINVTQSAMPPFEEYCEEIRSLWESRWLTNAGIKHQELVARLADYFGTNKEKILPFCNGHLALEAAFGLFEPGSEVITTPFTYVSTTLAIIRAGLTPVFCDIEPQFYTLDPKKIEPLITEKTVAIAPVHVYGNMCNCEAIEAVAARRGLKVIYDAAHAFGVKKGGVSSACFGDIVMFSFHATKVFHTIEGGCLHCRDVGLVPLLNAWEHFGIYHDDEMELAGTNAKMTEFSAAMGLSNLRHVDDYIARRREAVMRYRELLSRIPGLILCGEQSDVTPNYAYLPIQVVPEEFGADRDQVVETLKAENINARKYFYPLTSDTPLCRRMFEIQDTPIASEVSSRVICLPLYPDLSPDDIKRICRDLLSSRGQREA